MAELPFLVVHGALVWKLVWLVLVAATFTLGYAIRRRRARRRARERREVLLGEVTSPRAGTVVLRGRVTAGTATTTYKREHATEGAATLVVDCGGELVEIDGRVVVEEGSTMRVRPAVTRTIAVGDEVFASGVLSRGHASEEASYREAKVRWRLAGDPVVGVIAVAPRVKPLPLGVGALVGALLLVGLGGYGTLHLLGSYELHRAEGVSGTARNGQLPAFGAAELAAALPGHRDEALQAIERQLAGFHLAASQRALELELQLAELRGQCPSRILARQVRLEEALAAARRCGTQDEVVRLLAFLGKYDEAERALAPDDFSSIATTIHIATGNWRAAARGADAHAEELARETPSAFRTQRYLADVVAGQHCLAALFRSYGGDPRAFAALADRGTGAACAIFEAASLPLAQQATAFSEIPRTRLDNRDDGTSAGVDLVADELAYAAGEPRGVVGGEAISALMFMFDRSRIWVAPFQLETHPSAGGALAAMATYEILRGDLASARTYLARTEPSYAHDEIAIAIALRDGSPIADSGHRDHAGHDEAIALRNGVVDERIQIYLGDDEAAPFRALLSRAASGDGRALVEILALDGLQWQAFSIPLLGLLPRITRDRDAVVAALRLFRNDLTSYAMLHVPFTAVSDMISYRDVARLAGDTDDASHWQAIIDRHVEVLRDRRKVTAVLFWND